MEKIISLKEKLKKISLFIDTVESDNLSRIEKDILLQKIRDFYLEILDYDNNISVSEFEPVSNPKVQIATKEEPVKVEFNKEIQPIAVPIEKVVEPEVIIPEKIHEPEVVAIPEVVDVPVEIVPEIIDEFVVEFADSFDDEPIAEIEQVAHVEEVKIETVIKPVEEPIIKKEEPQVKKPVIEQATLFPSSSSGVKTIGEQLGTNKTSLNEMLASKNTTGDFSSRLKPVTDIKSAIGVGDRFLFIRELFGGNNETFEETIAHLNSLTSYSEAHDFLISKFNWDESQNTVSAFVNIVKRRYA
jgi:hypothetical protein